MKRKDYISWDEYFMGLALFSAERSKDPNTQVGACVAGRDNRIISMGYNGFPIGIDDETLSWEREGGFMDTKYAYVCHAELNAVLNARGKSVEGAKIYVAQFPCNECAKTIVQSGIAEVVYYDDKYADTDVVKASKKIFQLAGVKVREYKRSGKKVELVL